MYVKLIKPLHVYKYKPLRMLYKYNSIYMLYKYKPPFMVYNNEPTCTRSQRLFVWDVSIQCVSSILVIFNPYILRDIS